MKKLLLYISSFLVTVSLYSQDGSIQTYLSDLMEGSYEKKIEACRVLGKEKKTPLALDSLSSILLDDTNVQKEILLREVISALGYIGTPKSTEVLNKFIKTTNNSDLIYASLVSMLNISRVSGGVDSSTKDAFLYVNDNIKDDPFITQLLEKLKSKFGL